MAISNSIAAITRNLRRNLLSNQKPYFQTTKSFFSTTSSPDYTSDSLQEESPPLIEKIESITSENSKPPSNSESSSTFSANNEQRKPFTTVLEDGLDAGVYKAIIVGQVGQSPVQKRLKNGKLMTMLSVGTGGIRNERIPFANEEPREYADRCNVQWHRVVVYADRVGDTVMRHAQPGTILYLEGNLETKVFTDQVSGIVKHLREIAIRRNGRVVFLGNGSEFSQPDVNELKGVGYF